MYVAFKTNDERLISWLNSQENKSQAIKNIIFETLTKKEILENPNAKVELVIKE